VGPTRARPSSPRNGGRPTRESIRRNAKDILAGLTFAGVGLAFAGGALTYPIGTAARMGPGFFPLLAGGVLVLLGVVIVVKPDPLDAEGEALGRLEWRGLALIPIAIIVFGLSVRGLGLVPSLFVTVFIGALASRETRPVGALLLAIGLTVVSVLIFIVALRLNLPLIGPLVPRL
jgi:hypothetical protein